MALTYFAVTGIKTERPAGIDPTLPVDGHVTANLPKSLIHKVKAIVRLWRKGNPPTPSMKFVIIGWDIELSDSNVLREIPEQAVPYIRDAIVYRLRSRRIDIGSYSAANRNRLRFDIAVPSAVVAGV